jgi:Flp pilus assembly protein TadG
VIEGLNVIGNSTSVGQTQERRMRRRSESGLTIPLLALFMVVLIVMMALAIDVGVLYTARTSAQHAADSAALAGAFTYYTNSTAPNPNPNGSASAAAVATATKNTILGTPVSQPEVTVNANQPFVTVTIARTIPTFFAKVVDQNQAQIKVTATAQAYDRTGGAGGNACLRPFWVSNSQAGSCKNPLILPSGQVNPNINLANYPIQLHTADSPSQWGFVDEGSGANAIKNAISSCQNITVKCGTPLTVETGDISAISKPVQDLIGQPNQDTFIAPGEYSTSGGFMKPTSNSVIDIVILDDCNGQSKPGPGSQQTIDVAALGEVFVDNVTGSGNGKNPLTLNAHLVNYATCGAGGGGPASGGSSYGVVPVRLVQPPSQ